MDALSWLAFWSLAVGLVFGIFFLGWLAACCWKGEETYFDAGMLMILGVPCGLAFSVCILCTKIVGIIYVWLWASKYLGS